VICLTGDLHHMSLRTPDQAHGSVTEAEAGRIWAQRCRAAGVKATMYVTGRLVDEEWDALSGWLTEPGLEVGGHTFAAFEPSLFHRVCKKLIGNYNGPAWYERRDIGKTLDVIERRTGRRPRAWRNHAYFHGRNTDRLLLEAGLTSCSDAVRPVGTAPWRQDDGLVVVPMNVIPDHEHLYHGDRTPAEVERWARRYSWCDCHGSGSFDAATWTGMVLEQVEANEKAGVVSTLLLHPLCMDVLDGFRSFDRILEVISRHETCFVSDVTATLRM
jgi:hypothetical protein